jgi:endonuclease YncB( thermonuclease family)
MKWLSFLLILLVLASCTPAPADIVPPETLAAQTMAARPKTSTPGPTNTALPTTTATLDMRPPTPIINLSLPGAYCLPTNTPRTTALVTKVLDGATIEVATNNQTWQVKYIGLDAPSIVAPAEWQAPQSFGLNDRLVNGQNVVLVQDVTDVDTQGYHPRYVIVGNTFVNYEIIRQGMASAVSVSPDIACQNSLLSAQVEAQAAVIGVWQPTPPPTFTAAPSATVTRTPGPVSATSLPPCSCNRQYSCNMFPSRKLAQSCFDYCMNNGFGPVIPDKNNNGRVCEGSD